MATETSPPEDSSRDRDYRIESLVIEFLLRREAGEGPSIEDYVGRFPEEDQRRRFRECLESVLRVDAALPSISEIGPTFGSFRIDNEIGHGGMGVVYRAFDPGLARPLALKLLRPDKRGNLLHGERFEKEAKILAQIKHPNVVTVYETGCRDGLRYIAMDLVDGKPLSSVIKDVGLASGGSPTARHLADAIDRPVPPGLDSLIDNASYTRSVARIIRDAARGVEAAHACGVLHLDIKPRNIMLGGGGHPVVLDFGLARSSQIPDRRPVLGGTLPYLAPEQLRAHASASSTSPTKRPPDSSEKGTDGDVRTDIYQIGLTLYEMLTLQPARPGETVREVTREVERGTIPLLRGPGRSIPRDLEAICLKAASPRPEDRYQSAAALADDLDRFVAGEPTVARPLGPLRAIRHLLGRHRVAAAAALTLLVSATAVLVAWFLASPDTSIRLMGVLYERGRPTWRELVAGQAVSPGETLAVEINTDRPAVIYAISVTGHGSTVSPDVVTRLKPWLKVVNGEPVADSRLVPCLEMKSAGRYRMLLSRVDQPAGVLGTSGYEGLWLFLGRKRREWLEAWLDRLGPPEKKATPVPYKAAREMLLRALSGGGRGQSLDQLPEEERARLAGDIFDPEREENEIRGFRVYRVRFPITGDSSRKS